ncbi:hypothetical protein DFH06DRAFT_1189451 [Mycena polygramma]|nr:hypothetical protein DFH06DRAFT_1189451 [Mycena polygramma]
MAEPQPTTVSPRFNFADADVTFKSSDSVLFQVHRKNLEVCTEGFPPSNISTAGEVVPLTEDAITLELLFQFMYPQRHPALDTTPFEVLGPLAEAAEKYQVFPAMNICHIRLRDMVNDHPVEVAVYAAKHDYPFLLSEVAPMMISMDPVTVVEMLPPHLILPWIRYVHEWTLVLQTCAMIFPSNLDAHNHVSVPVDPFRGYNVNEPRCSWSQHIVTCLQRLGTGVQALRTLDAVFTPGEGEADIDVCCQRDLNIWRRQIEDGLAKIPKFSTFL